LVSHPSSNLTHRWQDNIHDPAQLEDPAVCDAVWRELMEVDTVGATWARDGKGIMRAPNRMNFGWRDNLAKIKAPTLMLLGEFDNYAKRIEAWHTLGAPQRMFIKVAHSTHFMQFERSRHLLIRAAASWFADGVCDGHVSGEFFADIEGKLVAQAA
jgi:pimeloyl-ACP methyl ester carboxylesterase